MSSEPAVLQRAGITLGANLGDPLAQLRAARDRLRGLSGGDFRQAPLFRSQPVGCPPGSPDFLNTVVAFDFAGSPDELLTATRAIEGELGRVRGEVNAPRTIDLDLLFLGDHRVETAELVLPHPRLALRRFVLEPLAALEPERLLPGQSQPVAELLATLASDEPPLELVARDW